MPAVLPTVNIDTSRLRAVIPRLTALGRRTVSEQCVTSAGWIFVNSQKLTPAVSLGRIDADLEVDVTPVTANGRPSKAKNPKHFKVTPGMFRRHATPRGVLIVMARMNAASRYNQLTGSRWAIPSAILPTGKGTAKDRQTIIGNILARMTMLRHSSTHYLQHGFAPAIKQAFASPLFQHSKKFRSANAAMGGAINKLNTDPSNDRLGLFLVSESGNSVQVVVTNSVGEDGPAGALNKKHRDALLRVCMPIVQNQVNAESASCEAELSRRIISALDPVNRQLA
jgi:hypothetical protein